MSITPGEIFGRLFDVVDILASTYDTVTKTITGQLGDVAKGVADSNNSEFWYGSPGITGRPAAPTQGNSACQSLILKRGDRDMVIAYRDLRASSIYGQLDQGETCVFATTGMARTLYKKDGSVTRYTTVDNTESGTSITDRLGPDGWTVTTPWGSISITESGLSISIEDGGAITITPEGIGKFIATQVAMQGSVAAIAGDVATCIGSGCVPVPGVNTAIYGASGVSGLPSANVYIAPAPT